MRRNKHSQSRLKGSNACTMTTSNIALESTFEGLSTYERPSALAQSPVM
jgi:hypothetical protein